MGREKALLPFRGGLLWQHQAAQLLALEPAELLISAKRAQSFAGYRVVFDDVSAAGPLAGIVALLSAAATDGVMVLAVDMPFVTAEFLKALLQASASGGVIPLTQRGYEPLAAFYPKAALPLAQNLLHSADRSLQNFARQLIEAGLGVPHHLTAGDEPMFRSLNSPDDWRNAESPEMPLPYSSESGFSHSPNDNNTF